MGHKSNLIKEIEYDLEDEIDSSLLFKEDIITQKYVQYMGLEYISDLSKHKLHMSNLTEEEIIYCIEHNILFLKSNKTKEIFVCLLNDKVPPETLSKFDFDKIAIISSSLHSSLFSNILISSSTSHSKKYIKFYKNKFFIYNIPRENCKAFDLFTKYYKGEPAILYISDFISYIFVSSRIFSINIRENNLASDINKSVDIISYSIEDEDRLIVVNNSSHFDIKNIFKSKELKYETTYVEQSNFQKIFESLPN